MEKAIRAMGYVEDKKEETKEKAGEITEAAKVRLHSLLFYIVEFTH